MSLSPEINDTIIDFLHNDKPSLCACCLTCKQWVSSSRFHLFSKITVTPFRIGPVLELLESASTDIASMVRKLVIEEFPACGFDHVVDDTMHAFPDKLRSLLLLLRSVEHLRVVGSHGVITAKIISVLTSVLELEMVDTRLTGLVDMLEFVYAFPLLQSLSIVDSTWAYCSVLPCKYNIRPGQSSFFVRTLSLDRAELSSITKWLLGLDPVPPVYTLRRTSYEHDTPRNDVALLDSVGPSVCTLELEFRTYFRIGGVDRIHNLVDVSNCTNLRKLRLLEIPTDSDYLSSHSSDPCTILSQISSHNMEELMMEFRRPEGISFDWTSLANILAGPTFAQLQNIHIEADVVPNGVHAICLQEDAWQTAERSLRHGALSMFDRRGILHFTLFGYEWGSRVVLVTSKASIAE